MDSRKILYSQKCVTAWSLLTVFIAPLVLAGDVDLPSWIPVEAKRVDSEESVRLLAELNAKWDGDLSNILSFDVTYRRCAVSYTNLKDYEPDDAAMLIGKLSQAPPPPQ